MRTLLLQSSVAPASKLILALETAQWYALYTSSRHEKQVAAFLSQRDVEFFLPLYNSIRRWKDRRVELQLPLFPGYIFVHVALRNRLTVLTAPGAVRFVAFNGRPAVLPETDLTRLRSGLDYGVSAQPHPYLQVGRRVRVRGGPLAGIEGILVRKKERFRLVVSIDLIMRSIAVEVDAADVEPIR
jgi:transcription antitermination factor NusG